MGWAEGWRAVAAHPPRGGCWRAYCAVASQGGHPSARPAVVAPGKGRAVGTCERYAAQVPRGAALMTGTSCARGGRGGAAHCCSTRQAAAGHTHAACVSPDHALCWLWPGLCWSSALQPARTCGSSASRALAAGMRCCVWPGAGADAAACWVMLAGAQGSFDAPHLLNR
jgi:hypothetical protein